MFPCRLRSALLIAFVAAGPLHAQTQSILAGSVVDSTGRALAGVDVSVPILKRTVRTDSAGRFRFGALTQGDYSIRARRLGFRPLDMRVQMSRDSTEIPIVMARADVTLDTVVVRSACPWRGYDGFICRQRAGGGGLFLDNIAIDSSKAEQLGDLFFDVKGFRVAVTPGGIKYPVATSGWMCVATIVDGLPINRYTNPLPVLAIDIIAVEIYEKANDVPKAYEQYSWIKGGHPDKRCGLILYWTSNGG